jgi:cob(I)alamin adenosyltransferase
MGTQERVCTVQFLKDKNARFGETRTAESLGMAWYQTGDGFVWKHTQKKSMVDALRAYEVAKQAVESGVYDLVIFDEFTYLFDFGWLTVQEFLSWVAGLSGKNPTIVITGRNVPDEVLALADTATEMRKVVHAYDAGIQAQSGIEY